MMGIPKRVLRVDGQYDPDKASRDSSLEFGDEPSLAVQSQKEEADINVIVKRFGVTGLLPQGSVRAPLDLDFVDVFDYQTAQNAILEADRAFKALPADVRASFKNDAGAFVDYCTGELDQAKLEQLRKWGLAVPAIEVTEPTGGPKVPEAGKPPNVAPAGGGVT